MIVFADYHHKGLADSLVALFEKRLGHKIYFPVGMDWFYSQNWAIGNPYPEPKKTALQFLNGGHPDDGTAIIHPPRGITFQEFKEMPIDIVIASYYDHIPLYQKLIDTFHPNAKLIVHFGNEWIWGPSIKNLMSSTAPLNLPSSVNAVYYHQEFDTSLYSPSNLAREKKITSYVNALNLNGLFRQDWKDFLDLEDVIGGEYDFYSYGGGCRNGSLDETSVADSMKKTQIVFHLKTGGDGYGFVIHQLAATGTPIIFRSSQYKGKLAEVFLEHEKTGFDLDKLPLVDLAKWLKSSPKEECDAMGVEIRERFTQNVDFNAEQLKIQKFLNDLQ